jgi:CheY-like chemotaxis protein
VKSSPPSCGRRLCRGYGRARAGGAREVGKCLFDLYLLDLSMPMMTGEELAILIRRYHPQAKLLYITAHSARLFQETALLKDTESFLQKPFGAQDLREAVSLMLFGHLQGLHANDAPLP